MTNPTNPGWYDDPESPDQLRYFDGIVWSRHTTPRAACPATPLTPPAPQPDSRRGRAGCGPAQPPGFWRTVAGAGRRPAAVARPQAATATTGSAPAGPAPGRGSRAARSATGRPDDAGRLPAGVLRPAGRCVLHRRADQDRRSTWSSAATCSTGPSRPTSTRRYAAAKAGRSSPIGVDLSQLNVGWLTAYVLDHRRDRARLQRLLQRAAGRHAGQVGGRHQRPPASTAPGRSTWRRRSGARPSRSSWRSPLPAGRRHPVGLPLAGRPPRAARPAAPAGPARPDRRHPGRPRATAAEALTSHRSAGRTDRPDAVAEPDPAARPGPAPRRAMTPCRRPRGSCASTRRRG